MNKGYEVLHPSNFGISDPFDQDAQRLNVVCPNDNCDCHCHPNENDNCACFDRNCACNDIDCSTRMRNR